MDGRRLCYSAPTPATPHRSTRAASTRAIAPLVERVAKQTNQPARGPAPDASLGAHLQGLCGNAVLSESALADSMLSSDTIGLDQDAFAQVVASNLMLASIGVDPAAGSFSGSNQAMLRAMRLVGGGRGASGGDAAVSQSLRRAGVSLPAELQARLEAHFGVSLDVVRVHTDATAASASRAIQARAFSTGTHVLFGHGEYRPNTTDGLELLAHEVTHVVQHLQQRTGAATAVENGVSVTLPSDGVEREAVTEAAAFVRGGSGAAPAVQAMEAPAAAIAPPLADSRSPTLDAPTLDAPTLDAPTLDAPAVSAPSVGAPSLGTGVLHRDDTPDSHGTVATVGGPGARAGGWEFQRQPDGSWKVDRAAGTTPSGVQTTGTAEAATTLASGVANPSVASGSTTVKGSGGTLTAEGTVLGASVNGEVGVSADSEGFAIKAEGGAQLTVVSGKLRYETPACAFTVLGETLKAKAYIELTAEVCAAVKGELGMSLKPGTDGVSLDGGGEAFAGARAGIKGGIAAEWQPKGASEFLDLAGAFAGAEGWAGAAAAFDSSFSL